MFDCSVTPPATVTMSIVTISKRVIMIKRNEGSYPNPLLLFNIKTLSTSRESRTINKSKGNIF